MRGNNTSKSEENWREHANMQIIFEVGGEEILGPKSILMEKSEYLSDLLSEVSIARVEQEIRILLPKWAIASTFQLLLRYIQDLPLGILTIGDSQRLLWLSDFLKIPSLSGHCINSLIIPKLTKDNSLSFLEDAYAKLSASEEVESIWFILFNRCLDLGSRHAHYLFKLQAEGILEMDREIIEDLISRAFQMHHLNSTVNNTPFMDILSKIREQKSVFELLEDESERIMSRDKPLLISRSATPTLTWSVNATGENFYVQTDPVCAMGTYWVLTFWSYHQQGVAYLGISHSKNPSTIATHGGGIVPQKYYGQNNYYRSTIKGGIAGNNILNKLAGHKHKDKSENVKETVVDYLGGDVQQFPNHCMLTLASFVRIQELEEAGEGIFGVASLITLSKAPTLLRQVALGDLLDNNGKITIHVYFRVEYTHSAILTYISRNINIFYTDTTISKLTKNQFHTLLRHKYLNIAREEDILVAFCLWYNLNPTEEVSELLENINWGFMTIEALFEIPRKFPKLRENNCFQHLFEREMSRRLKNEGPKEPARFSYQFLSNQEIQKPQIIQMVNAILDPKDEIITLIENAEF